MTKFFDKLIATGNPRNLWKRYIFAIALIIALLTTTHVAASMALHANAKNADLVNKSGRQRMLSQRIMYLSLQAVDHDAAGTRERLLASVDLFEDSQADLARRPSLSAELLGLYEGPAGLNARVAAYADPAREIALREGDPQANLQKLLDFDSETLLRDLDRAVSGFEAVANADAERLETVQNISFYAAVLILLIEGVIIFLPAQRLVSRSISDLERQSKVITQAKVEMMKRNQELEVMKEKVEHEAMHDSLTGLPNRRSLQLSMQKYKARAATAGGTISVMHIDLDRFKEINDTLGHAAGDHVLTHVAKTLCQCVSEDEIVARVGGDEFVILPKLNASTEYLSDLAEAIITAMRRPVPFNDSVCQFGASIGIGIGISSEDTSASDPSELLVKADIALYRAKELGRGRYEFFSDALAEEVESTKKTSDELLTAFEDKQFIVHYQPIFDARSQRICSLEALVRWQHPDKGILPAGAFIDHVYRLGLAAELDVIVLEQVERDVATAKTQGVSLAPVAINVSANSLQGGQLFDRIRRSPLIEHGLSLEISESVDFEREIEAILDKLNEMRDLGVTIEIDDFGTGHASIFSFQQIEPHRIKIARELLIDVESSKKTRQLILGTCRMAKAFGAEVVAEGAENAEMARTLQMLGCDYIQGFGLSRPKGLEQLIYEISMPAERAPKSA